MKYLLASAAIAIALFACGKVESDSTHAEVIPSPNSNVTCYAIYSEGKVVAGNCVPN